MLNEYAGIIYLIIGSTYLPNQNIDIILERGIQILKILIYIFRLTLRNIFSTLSIARASHAKDT